MKLQTFFEKFDQFSDAPDAVAKMREIVLELAVHGKLNQGSSADQNGWPLKRLKDLTSKIGSGSTPHGGRNSYHENGTPLIRSMNVHFRKFVRDGLAFIDDVQASALSNVIVEPKDVLLNITGASIGRVTLAPEDMAGARVNQHVAIIRAKHELLPRFLEIVLASPTFQSLIDGIQVGATREALTKRMIEEFEVPLPATSEQISVISRVNELMALCDRMEAQQKDREIRHAALSSAAIARFDEAPTPANLNFLFHSSYSVTPADLRKTILNLAISGGFAQDSTTSPVVIGDVVKLVSGQHLLADEQNTEKHGIPYLTGPADFGVKSPIPSRWTEMPKVVAEPGDILITVKGAGVGKTNKLVTEKTAISRQLMAVRAIHANPDFIHLVLMNAANHFQSLMTGIAIPGIGRSDVLGLEFELPSLAEQGRIVQKVEMLMSLVGQLETQLEASKNAAKDLLDAVVHELLHPTAEVVEFPLNESDRASRRAAIGCYAIEHLLRNPSFGRVMLMKSCYLAETHLGLPLGWQPMRQAAGPWDPWIEDFESIGTRSDWFTVTEKALYNGHGKIEYSTKKGIKTKAAEAIKVLGSQKAEFDRLLDLFADKSTEDAEIITTLFAAWNDFLIDGKAPTDDEIICEVRENWHHSKGRFSPALLKRWLNWMRRNHLVPRAHGPRTIQQFRLPLQCR